MSEPPQTGRHSYNGRRPPKAISRKPGKLATPNTSGYSASVRKVSGLVDSIALKSNAVSRNHQPTWPLLSPDKIKQEASPFNNHSLVLQLNTRASRIPLPSWCVRNVSAIDRRCQRGVTSVGTQDLDPVLMDSTITASPTSPPAHYLQPNPHYPLIHPSTSPRASSTVPTVPPKGPSCVRRSSTTDGIPTTAHAQPAFPIGRYGRGRSLPNRPVEDRGSDRPAVNRLRVTVGSTVSQIVSRKKERREGETRAG